MQVKCEDFKRMRREDLNYGEKAKTSKPIKESKVARVKSAFKNMTVKDLLGIDEDENLVI